MLIVGYPLAKNALRVLNWSKAGGMSQPPHLENLVLRKVVEQHVFDVVWSCSLAAQQPWPAESAGERDVQSHSASTGWSVCQQ